LKGSKILETLISHINERGERKPLREHLNSVAQNTSTLLRFVGLAQTGFLAGLTHDFGKAKAEFVAYLEKSCDSNLEKKPARGSVNHTFAGVRYILENFHTQTPKTEQQMFKNFTAELVAYAVGAHHGLFDAISESGKDFLHRLNYDKKEIHYDEAKENFLELFSENEIEEIFKKAVCEIQKVKFNTKIDTALLSRLILSALIASDRKNAREFDCGLKDGEVKFDFEANLAFLENKLKSRQSDSPINKIRKKISDEISKKANLLSGIYRLNAPTGAGKTLATLRFALAHAVKKQKSRVVFVAPFLSIIEQNAKVIKEHLLAPLALLEHHSNAIKPHEGELLDSYELHCQNWQTPLITTTFMQFLNTLFDGATTSVARFCSLINSVIVIDEVQSIPPKVTYMLNETLNFLSSFCNATIVLSSATQPKFDSVKHPLNISGDLLNLSAEELKPFERVKFSAFCAPKEAMDFAEFGEFCKNLASNKNSLLVVCNTRKQARELFSSLKNENGDVFHLSTSMCVAHRKAVLEQIKKRLKSGLKCVCVSTQLIEAGVDVSFESVVRVKAGLDSLIQAAGRCNREGESENKGEVL